MTRQRWRLRSEGRPQTYEYVRDGAVWEAIIGLSRVNDALAR
jgi:hypothetical protein